MFCIKQAAEADIPVIQELAFVTWKIAYSEILSSEQLDYMLELIYSSESLSRQMNEQQHRFIIVYNDAEPVGFASYSPKEGKDASIYRLHKLYVLPGQQGKGTGKYLLDHIIKKIKLAGATILELNVNRHNKAMHFYEKEGFTIKCEEDIDIGNGYFMNDYVMELSI